MTDRRIPRLAGNLVGRALRLRNFAANAMTIGVRGMVLDERRGVFLVRHGYTPGWHMPGGAVDAGETIAEALARELVEEGNLHLTGAVALHGLYRNPRYPRDHVVRAFEQPAAPRPNREIAESGFFRLDALPDGTTPATLRRLAEVLDGTPPAADW